jgi:hypothetical protein
VLRITGTYDFRWPLRTTIRVNFQPYGDINLIALARAKVAKAFQSWQVYDTITSPGIQLAYELTNVDVPAVDDGPDDRGVEKHYAGVAIESTYPREAHLRGMLDNIRGVRRPFDKAKTYESSTLFKYDVLVSIAPLPLLTPQNPLNELGPTLIEFPQSELGAYSRREDFGMPTIYIGRPKAAAAKTDIEWFESAEGVFTVVHEIGHVLGLAHEHQNPKRELQWKNDVDINAILAARNGGELPFDEDFASKEIKNRWPGSDQFSEWRDVDPQNRGGRFESVMTKPIAWCLIQGHKCDSLELCDTEQTGYQRLSTPQPEDLKQLSRMYGRDRV